MKNIFLYPLHQTFKGSPNPYMHHFRDALAKRGTIVNAKATHRGVLGLFIYFFKTDVFILNWIEFLSEKRFGNLQIYLFMFFCWFSKLFTKRIIWVLHNKGSHHGGSKYKTEKMFRILMKRSDCILTHSDSGKDFVNEYYPFAAEKVNVIIHPVQPPFDESISESKDYDLLIWGSIHPYKGIDQFLEFIDSSSEFANYKILIVGKCFNSTYKENILNYTRDNIIFKDQIFSLNDISNFASKSKFVLFTYKSETILSSGVLMDTLRMDTQILGPDYAAFKDLKSFSCISTYSSFEDISSIIENYDSSKIWNYSQRWKFHEENSWDSFAIKVFENF